MLDFILQLDREILIFLNNLGTQQWDPFWLFITKQFNWLPLFLTLLGLLLWKFGWKNSLLILVFVAVVVAFSDQFTNFIKHSFGRIRPCNEESLVGLIRDLSYKPGGYSYYSGHAAVSTTVTTFLILLFRKHFKAIYFLVLFPLLFGYSRIYLGVHYPFDVLSGYLAGIFFGCIFFKIQERLRLSTRF